MSSEMERSPEDARPVESDSGDEDRRSDSVLRAKYADFCSAQLTELFLSLSDERIYEIVQEEARARDLSPGAIGFRAMVRLATNHLRRSVPLPDFESWRRDYEEDPERYDRYLLGLWRQLTESPEAARAGGEGGDGGGEGAEPGGDGGGEEDDEGRAEGREAADRADAGRDEDR